jgi:hypothetical protein
MVKKVILGLVVFFVVMGGATFWIFSSFDRVNAEADARSAADFTTEHFVITELWEMQKKKGSNVLSSYLYMKVKNEPVSLRLPWQGLTEDQVAIASKLNDGDSITVKVLSRQLASARENGVLKAINRFIMGDKREVTIFRLSVNGQLLVDKDIHSWDEGQVTLLNRLADNPFILLLPAGLLIFIVGYIKRRRATKQETGVPAR